MHLQPKINQLTCIIKLPVKETTLKRSAGKTWQRRSRAPDWLSLSSASMLSTLSMDKTTLEELPCHH